MSGNNCSLNMGQSASDCSFTMPSHVRNLHAVSAGNLRLGHGKQLLAAMLILGIALYQEGGAC